MMRVYPVLPGRIFIRGSTKLVREPELAAFVRGRQVTMAVSLFRHDERLAKLVENYWYHPMPDAAYLEPAQLLLLAKQIASKLEVEGGAVLVNCRQGFNRSGLVAGLILRELRQVSGEAALNAVRTARAGALSNPEFAAFLSGLPAPEGVNV